MNIDPANKQSHWIERIAKKVPAEVAGSVIVLIVFLWMSPSILEKMMTEEHVSWYLLFLGITIVGQIFATSLHAISNFYAKKNESLLGTQSLVIRYPSRTNATLKTEKQIEEAVELMKEDRENA